MQEDREVSRRLQRALEVIDLPCDATTMTFLKDTLNRYPSVDDFVDIIGPFIEENSNCDLSPEEVHQVCSMAYDVFMQADAPMEEEEQSETVEREIEREDTVIVVEGLDAWLRELCLGVYTEKAYEWCKVMGPAHVSEIWMNIDDFISSLSMRHLEKNRMRDSAAKKLAEEKEREEEAKRKAEKKKSARKEDGVPRYEDGMSARGVDKSAEDSVSEEDNNPMQQGLPPEFLRPDLLPPSISIDRGPSSGKAKSTRSISSGKAKSTPKPIPKSSKSGSPENASAQPGSHPTQSPIPSPYAAVGGAGGSNANGGSSGSNANGGASNTNRFSARVGGGNPGAAPSSYSVVPDTQPNTQQATTGNPREVPEAGLDYVVDAMDGAKLISAHRPDQKLDQRMLPPQGAPKPAPSKEKPRYDPKLCFGPAKDPYVQLDRVGKGGFATVFRCIRASNPDFHFAVKVIHLRELKLRSLNPESYQQDLNKIAMEAKILADLRNPYITSLVDVAEARDCLYLVMEFIKHGELLEQIMEARNGRFSEPEARYVFVQISAGLQYVHDKNIVHRDLKPDNILVSRIKPLISKDALRKDRRWSTMMNFDPDQVGKLRAYEIKISDFGLAKVIGTGFSVQTQRVGTQQYWAPEVARATHEVARETKFNMIPGVGIPSAYTFSCDIWSLGCVLYVMLFGRWPFIGEETAKLQETARLDFTKPNISNEAKFILTSLIRVDPRTRMTLNHCLRCRWAGRPLMQMKCDYYKTKVEYDWTSGDLGGTGCGFPMNQPPRVPRPITENSLPNYWRSRRILLPVGFDDFLAITFVSELFCSFSFNMDPLAEYPHSHFFPTMTGIIDRDNMRLEQSGNSQVLRAKRGRDIRLLASFKHMLSGFINDNYIEDVCNYEMTSYQNQYFCLVVQYVKEEDETIEVLSPQPLVDPPKTIKGKPCGSAHVVTKDGGPTNPKATNFTYSRHEDVITYSLIYEVLQAVFGTHPLLELVVLRVDKESVARGIKARAKERQKFAERKRLEDKKTGTKDASDVLKKDARDDGFSDLDEPNPDCMWEMGVGIRLAPNHIGNYQVTKVFGGSPMEGYLFRGDVIREIEGQPAVNNHYLEIYCRDGRTLLVQRGA